MFHSSDFAAAREKAAKQLAEASAAFVQCAGLSDRECAELWRVISRDPRLLDRAITRFGARTVQRWQETEESEEE